MRKIALITELDPESFCVRTTLKQKLDDNTVVTIFSEVQPYKLSKYSKEQLLHIEKCNAILALKNMEILTDDEIEYMLDPSGMTRRLETIENEINNTETLQKLAGFRVEKKIIPLG